MLLPLVFLCFLSIDSLQVPHGWQTYTSTHIDTSITIDGRLDEAAWNSAEWSSPFVDILGSPGKTPLFQTRMKIVWNDEYLFLGAHLTEPDLWATIRTRDSVMYRDNDFELFIDPDGDGRKYVELEINALGTVWDLLLMRTYREGGPALTDWNIKGLQSAVRLEGTLNNPADRDSGWTVEIAIPWATFDTLGVMSVPPVPGDSWRMNFSRVEWKLEVIDGRYRKTGLPEDNWVWSPQGVINMHLPERWGNVVFTDSRR